jgi:hypothetical protein
VCRIDRLSIVFVKKIGGRKRVFPNIPHLCIARLGIEIYNIANIYMHSGGVAKFRALMK